MVDLRQTYLLVDGENLDATLGGSVLERKPAPEERPRWDRLLSHLQQRWGQPVSGLFFLAVHGELPSGFVQALRTLGYRPIPLTGPPHVKVVDVAIQRTLVALRNRGADVVLASHDGDFVGQMEALCDGRRIALVGFPEFFSRGYAPLRDRGVEFVDLETDVGAFNAPLPRLRVIPIDEFDPQDFL